MSYKEHMTTEYDSKFSEVKGLEWDPWVGKNYHKTGIFIVGMSTDQRDGDDWTQNLKSPLTSRDASRTLAACVNTADEKPFQCSSGVSFQNTVKMFIEGADAEYDARARATFWESVAFNNYYQVAVPKKGDTPEQPDIKKSKCAFSGTVEIIKPRLVVVWGVRLYDTMGFSGRYESEPIGSRRGACPRVFSGDGEYPPIVWIQHPSQLQGANHQTEWLNFLRKCPNSKAPIENFINHLKQQLN